MSRRESHHKLLAAGKTRRIMDAANIEGGQDITILVHRKKKATTREELECFTRQVRIFPKYTFQKYIGEISQ